MSRYQITETYDGKITVRDWLSGAEQVVFHRSSNADYKYEYETGRESLRERQILFSKWEDILTTAQTNPSLADAINKVEMIYALVRTERG